METFDSFYKSVKGRKFNTWCSYTERLDTYGCGCQHDCKYCYAKTLLAFRGFWNSKQPKVANLVKVKLKLQSLQAGSIVRLGGMVDCFQPLELTERLTYNTIKIMNFYRIHYLIFTKSSLVTNHEYLAIYDKKLAHFHISISCTDDTKAKEYEGSALISERIKSIELLYSIGFDVTVRLSPFIYQYTDFEKLNSIKCNKILIEFLKVNHWVKKWFKIDYSDYSLKYGGYENLQLNQKIELVRRITGFEQMSVGEYVKEHYLYFRENVNNNKLDCCNLNYNKITNPIQLELY